MTTGIENAVAIPTVAVTPAEFDQAISDAQLKARKLKEIVEQAKLFVELGRGKKYLMVEAWQTIGRAYGYTTKIAWSHQIESGGWEAHAVVVDALGAEVGAAEAECGTQGDSPWDTRPSYQQRSMAQTRATSKALRSLLSWVVVLAGYEATPSDEMPRENHSPQPVTKPQLDRLFTIIKERDVDDETVKEYMHATMGVEHTKDLNREQYDTLVAWVQEQS